MTTPLQKFIVPNDQQKLAEFVGRLKWQKIKAIAEGDEQNLRDIALSALSALRSVPPNEIPATIQTAANFLYDEFNGEIDREDKFKKLHHSLISSATTHNTAILWQSADYFTDLSRFFSEKGEQREDSTGQYKRLSVQYANAAHLLQLSHANIRALGSPEKRGDRTP
ncbi:MAG: hypothetical protein ACK502_04370 [Alphaproteobacteria bacterium]